MLRLVFNSVDCLLLDNRLFVCCCLLVLFFGFRLWLRGYTLFSILLFVNCVVCCIVWFLFVLICLWLCCLFIVFCVFIICVAFLVCAAGIIGSVCLLFVFAFAWCSVWFWWLSWFWVVFAFAICGSLIDDLLVVCCDLYLFASAGVVGYFEVLCFGVVVVNSCLLGCLIIVVDLDDCDTCFMFAVRFWFVNSVAIFVFAFIWYV